MAHDVDEVCGCVSEHRPPVLELHAHHSWPVYLGGPKDGPVVWVCPTTHASIHELLRMMLRAGRVLSYWECQVWSPRPVARYAWTLAAEGFRHYWGSTT